MAWLAIYARAAWKGSERHTWSLTPRPWAVHGRRRTLGHAIALGVERRWTEAFDDLYGPAVQSVDEEEVEEYRRVARDACRAFLDRRS